MKNFLFYIIFLLSTINLSAQTYQYHSFIDTTKVWDYNENGTDCITLHDYYLGFAFFKEIPWLMAKCIQN